MAELITSLRERIRSGHYATGTWLPPERELADEFGVTRRAVRRAILRLSEEGLVSCRARYRPVVEGDKGAEARATLPTENASPGDIPAIDRSMNARLVALIMWHGGSEEGVTAQQRIFWGMNQRLAQDGFHGIFLDLGDRVRSEQENAEREAAHLRYVLEQGFAGVVFYPYAYRRNRELIHETSLRVPLVLIDRMIPGIHSDFVGVDNQRAMYEATRHLIDLGHRRVLFATKAESINTVQDRLEGYRQAIFEAPEGPLPEMILTVPAQPSFTEWPPIFESMFRLPEEHRPTAVLCINDYVALDIYRQLGGLGLRVPEDVALCGFDNIISSLPNHVGLTTIAQPFEQIGYTAADIICARYRDGASPSVSGFHHRELMARLVIRASTDQQSVGAADTSAPVNKTGLVHFSS